MVAGFRFFNLPFIFLQLVRVPERDAVQSGQHLVLLVVLPVRTGYGRQLERFQGLGIGQVRSDAHIDIVALLIERDDSILRQVCDMLHLVDFPAVLHQLHRFLPGQRVHLERQVFLHDLLHFRFNRRQVLIRQFHFSQVDVIVEALFRCGAVREVRIRIKPFHSLRHDMRSRMAQHFQLFRFGTFRNMSVIVDDLHLLSPPVFFPWCGAFAI